MEDLTFIIEYCQPIGPKHILEEIAEPFKQFVNNADNLRTVLWELQCPKMGSVGRVLANIYDGTSNLDRKVVKSKTGDPNLTLAEAMKLTKSKTAEYSQASTRKAVVTAMSEAARSLMDQVGCFVPNHPVTEKIFPRFKIHFTRIIKVRSL